MADQLKESIFPGSRTHKPTLQKAPGIECPHCKTTNSSVARYCTACGMRIDAKHDTPEPRSRGHPIYNRDPVPHHHTCPIF